MKLQRATQFVLVFSLYLVVCSPAGFSQSVMITQLSAAPAATLAPRLPSTVPVRAYPSLPLWSGGQLSYVGMFTPDGIFRTPSRGSATTGFFLEESVLPASSEQEQARRASVPTSMLISTERVVENYEPPLHAQEAAHAPTRTGQMRNRFLTFAYGHLSVLDAPRHLTTDSKQRLIVSDPDSGAVHVLDSRGKSSFRIVAGRGRRLRRPESVAVDGNDNIYVADSERGFVVVFDRNGGFLRYLGNYRGEPQYARPTGLAIDRDAKRLYLTDTPRNLVFVLDFEGNVLKRLGRARDGSGKGDFDEPTEVAVNHQHVYVLDSRGTRVQVLNKECEAMGSFPLPQGPDPLINVDNGLGTDRQGNVYVSSIHSSTIRVFSPEGRLLSVFGQPGHGLGEFVGPVGVWIDANDRLYVADSGNGRVQLFQLKSGE